MGMILLLQFVANIWLVVNVPVLSEQKITVVQPKVSTRNLIASQHRQHKSHGETQQIKRQAEESPQGA
jgi:hypothetical protein